MQNNVFIIYYVLYEIGEYPTVIEQQSRSEGVEYAYNLCRHSILHIVCLAILLAHTLALVVAAVTVEDVDIAIIVFRKWEFLWGNNAIDTACTKIQVAFGLIGSSQFEGVSRTENIGIDSANRVNSIILWRSLACRMYYVICFYPPPKTV